MPEIAPAIARRKTIRTALRTNRAVIEQHIQQVRAAYDANNCSIRKFNEYKADFDKQNTQEVKGIFSALDLANEKKALLTRLKTNADSVADNLKELGDVSVQSELEETLKAGSRELRDWWHTEGAKQLNVSSTEQDVQKFLKQAVDSLKSFVALTTDRIKELDDKIAELQNELKKTFSENDSMQKIADLRANADKRLKAVTALKQNYQKYWKALIDALLERWGNIPLDLHAKVDAKTPTIYLESSVPPFRIIPQF